MPTRIRFQAIAEAQPGDQWKALFGQFWPSYRSWFLRQGAVARAGFLECRRALRQHMPELVPTWEQLVHLAGGGDVEARFLSLWCPPPYITGCSQAVWLPGEGGGGEPLLLRNYDFAPALLEWMVPSKFPNVTSADWNMDSISVPMTAAGSPPGLIRSSR